MKINHNRQHPQTTNEETLLFLLLLILNFPDNIVVKNSDWIILVQISLYTLSSSILSISKLHADNSEKIVVVSLFKSVSISISERIIEVSEDLPQTDGEISSFSIIGSVEDKDDRYFLIDYVNEQNEPIVILYLEEITLDDYLDIMLEEEMEW